jgi:hypothetical protein
MFTRDYVKPQATPAFIPPHVLQAIRGTHVNQAQPYPSAKTYIPFRDRLIERGEARPLSTMAMLSQMDQKKEVVQARRRKRPAAKRRSGVPDLPRHATQGGGGAGGGSNYSNAPSSGKWTDITQVTFAGLAALGLAGLSVLAAGSALNGGELDSSGSSDRTVKLTGPIVVPQGAASAQALQPIMSAGLTGAWFDYDAFATDVNAAQDKYAAEQHEAAEAERVRVAEANARAETDVAEAEALRLAQEEAAAKAAAEAKAKRMAQAEADRIAAEEAERARLAALALKQQQQAKIDADAERLRIAEAEAAAKADAAAARLAEQNLQAEKQALAKETKLAAARAAQAQRVADERAAREAEREIAAANASQARARMVASIDDRARDTVLGYQGVIPTAASLKPMRPAALARRAPVRSVNAAPAPRDEALESLRALATPRTTVVSAAAPQRIDFFMAERVRKTAVTDIATTNMDMFRQTFVSLVRETPDGQTVEARTPDGRTVQVTIEQTRPIQVSRPTVRPIDFSAARETGTMRYVSEAQPAKETIMCRDVTYAFVGAERGRFAACPTDAGDFTISRASEKRAFTGA